MTTERITAVAVFKDHARADRAVDDLKRAGFRDDQIGVVARNTRSNEAEAGSQWEEGTVTGLLAGTGLGALVGLGILAGIVPGIGPIITAGTLTFLASTAGGAAIGGVVGAFVGLGLPESEARYYENEVKEGRTVVTVKADGRSSEATAILQRHGYDRSTASTVDMIIPPAPVAAENAPMDSDEVMHVQRK